MELAEAVYKITAQFSDHEKFSLINKMRRAAVSVVSNIAEGAARKSGKDRRRFYEIARSSLVEIDTQFEVAIRLNYLKPDQNELIQKTVNNVSST